MQEVENINMELETLADWLGRIESREIEDILDDDENLTELRETIWQRHEDRVEMKARFDHLNATLEWWSSQCDYVLSRVTGPSSSGFRAPSPGLDGTPQPMAAAQNWHSPRDLLRRQWYQPLERALKLWTDDLLEREMLDPKDLKQIQFDPPADEFTRKRQTEDRKRIAEFEVEFQKVLDKVKETATRRERGWQVPHRQALGVWNVRFNGRYRCRELLVEYIRELTRRRLLPKSYGMLRTSEDLIRKVLGA